MGVAELRALVEVFRGATGGVKGLPELVVVVAGELALFTFRADTVTGFAVADGGTRFCRLSSMTTGGEGKLLFRAETSTLALRLGPFEEEGRLGLAVGVLLGVVKAARILRGCSISWYHGVGRSLGETKMRMSKWSDRSDPFLSVC